MALIYNDNGTVTNTQTGKTYSSGAPGSPPMQQAQGQPSLSVQTGQGSAQIVGGNDPYFKGANLSYDTEKNQVVARWGTGKTEVYSGGVRIYSGQADVSNVSYDPKTDTSTVTRKDDTQQQWIGDQRGAPQVSSSLRAAGLEIGGAGISNLVGASYPKAGQMQSSTNAQAPAIMTGLQQPPAAPLDYKIKFQGLFGNQPAPQVEAPTPFPYSAGAPQSSIPPLERGAGTPFLPLNMSPIGQGAGSFALSMPSGQGRSPFSPQGIIDRQGFLSDTSIDDRFTGRNFGLDLTRQKPAQSPSTPEILAPLPFDSQNITFEGGANTTVGAYRQQLAGKGYTNITVTPKLDATGAFSGADFSWYVPKSNEGIDYKISAPGLIYIWKRNPTNALLDEARANNPLRDLPVFGEDISMMGAVATGLTEKLAPSGYSYPMEKQLLSDTSNQEGYFYQVGSSGKNPLSPLEKESISTPALALGLAETGISGFVKGMGIGSVAGATLASVAPGLIANAPTIANTGLANVGLQVAKQGATGAGVELAGSVLEKRPFSVENAASNTILFTGGAQLSQQVFFASGLRGAGAFAQQAGGGAITGAIIGAAYAPGIKTSFSDKPLVIAPLVGGAIGGVTGASNYWLESKGIKPVFETTRLVQTEGNVQGQPITGFKFGIETINTQSGEMKFFGGALTKEGGFLGTGSNIKSIFGNIPDLGAYTPAGGTVQPTGVFETKLYTPEMEGQIVKENVKFFQMPKINAGALSGELQEMSSINTEMDRNAIIKSDAVLGGGPITRASQFKSDLPVNTPAGKEAFVAKSPDYDLNFYFNPSGKSVLSKNLGGAIVGQSEQPLSFVGYPKTVDKYVIQSGGKEFDINALYPSAFEPRPATPLGSYATSYSFEKIGGLQAISARQQVVNLGMTIGVTGEGAINTIEAGKTKYLGYINAQTEASGQKANLPAINENAINMEGINAGSLGIPSISVINPTGAAIAAKLGVRSMSPINSPLKIAGISIPSGSPSGSRLSIGSALSIPSIGGGSSGISPPPSGGSGSGSKGGSSSGGSFFSNSSGMPSSKGSSISKPSSFSSSVGDTTAYGRPALLFGAGGLGGIGGTGGSSGASWKMSRFENLKSLREVMSQGRFQNPFASAGKAKKSHTGRRKK